MGLPRQGTLLDDLKCKKCGKTFKECPPAMCQDPECPNKPKKTEKREDNS